MKNFEYAIPESIEKTLEYLSPSNAILKAGGIDLLDRMKEQLESPGRLVNIRDLEDLRFLKEDTNGSFLIGPGQTLTEISDDQRIKKSYRALADAARGVASVQIRNTATIGGNLCQRPRCWYFRSADFHCSRKGGDTCFALDGENQYHAIFDNADGCAIVHPSATAVALMALDARLIIKDEKNEKEIPIEEFFVRPAENIEKENILNHNEMIVSIIIPAKSRNFLSYYCKHKEKLSFDWPLADVAVALRMEGQRCLEARVVLGSAAPVPFRSNTAEQVLTNATLNKDTAMKAAEAAIANAEPLSLNEYKVPLFKTIIFRTICHAVGIDPIGLGS
jgi:xanthine dehydrogenase YagS FAD-binding subunit